MKPVLAAAVALATLFSSSAALAHVDCDIEVNLPAPHVGYQPRGHYETRNVSVWRDGHYEQQLVKGQCYVRRHHRHGWNKTVCEADRYVSVWVPGYYETVPQQVWVAEESPPVVYSQRFSQNDARPNGWTRGHDAEPLR